jgi:hypothetical protein
MTTPFPASEPDSNRIIVERRFPDGRLAEVLDLGTTALIRVHAPSGRVYLEKTYADVAEATAAMTVWDGESSPAGKAP